MRWNRWACDWSFSLFNAIALFCHENSWTPASLLTGDQSLENYYRLLISLRSLNTEFQERTFGQANAITTQTSNNHLQHTIDNTILRIQAESSSTIQTISQQNGEVSRLASVRENLPNTQISTEIVRQNSLEFQSHLERISEPCSQDPGYGGDQHHQALNSSMV